jgi:hypothetical protein
MGTNEQGKDQRDAVERSFEEATEEQPENFRNEATDDKKVEVGPDMTKAPIKRIDPP